MNSENKNYPNMYTEKKDGGEQMGGALQWCKIHMIRVPEEKREEAKEST